MKGLFLTIFILFSTAVYAQADKSIDSVFYLLDTNKTPVNDRMWEVINTDLYNQYVLQCPCLQFGGNPTFYHERKDKGKIISRDQFKNLKLSSITELINVSKKFLDNGNLWNRYLFFIVEYKGSQYITYKVIPTNPIIKIISGPDIIQAKPDSSAFTSKGLIWVRANEVKNYLNERIITSGRVIDTKIDADGSVLLQVNDGNTPGFKVLITQTDMNKFDLPERHYRSTRIQVTGRVIKYKGELVLNINNENQILILR